MSNLMSGSDETGERATAEVERRARRSAGTAAKS